MKNRLIALCFLSLPGLTHALPPVPASEQSGPITLRGGTVHLGTGQVIDTALVSFVDGRITLVVDARTVRVDLSGHQVIDVSGQHIYPGFILPNSTLGLEEVSSLPDTVDHTERGDLNPNLRSLVAYNTDSELIPTTRFNGVLIAQIAPRGGLLSGTSSIVELDGWNWEDAAYLADDGIHLNWPGKRQGQFDFTTFSVKFGPNKAYQQQIERISKLFEDAISYGDDSQRPGRNLKLEALQRLFDGDQRLYLHSNGTADLVAAVNFAIAHGVKHPVVISDDAALDVADFLAEKNVPVIITGVHNRPGRDDDDIDLPYRLPALLTAAGVKVGLTYPSVMNARNLPFIAGTAVAYGMTSEAAVQMITLNNAEILGIADRAGSIEVGKDATLFVSKGDALDMRGNDLSYAFIRGKAIQLDAMQQELYRRFREKYATE